MAAPKRTQFQREKDLQTIASLYLRGVFQADIAAKLKVSRQQIGYDIKELQRRWQQSALVDIDAAKGKELAKIDETERQAWRGWRRSVVESEKHMKMARDADGVRFIESREEKEKQVGDPRYLQIVLACVDRRVKILGLDAPKKLIIDDWRDEARKNGISDVENLFEQLVQAAVDRASQGGSVDGS